MYIHNEGFLNRAWHLTISKHIKYLSRRRIFGVVLTIQNLYIYVGVILFGVQYYISAGCQSLDDYHAETEL